MLIFIDTEFTDFLDPELISIGLVTDDGRNEFYAELPVNLTKCSDFVVATVLPQLGNVRGAQCSANELNNRLRQWLEQFAHRAPVTICFDYTGDWNLLFDVLKGDIPGWLTTKNIYPFKDPRALHRFFTESGQSEHHALHDARANRYAFDQDKLPY